MTKTTNPKGQAGDILVYCAFDKIVELAELKPNPKNPNRHPENQIEMLAKIIETQGWRAPVKVSTRSGYIVSGHGRYLAAQMIGCPVPVDYQDYSSEAEEMADLLADNRIAELSEMDNAMLAEIFSEMNAEEIDLSLTGYTDDTISELTGALTDAVMMDIDDINSISEASTHKLKIDRTVIELTDEEYDDLVAELDRYIEINGVSFGFVRWMLHDDSNC